MAVMLTSALKKRSWCECSRHLRWFQLRSAQHNPAERGPQDTVELLPSSAHLPRTGTEKDDAYVHTSYAINSAKSDILKREYLGLQAEAYQGGGEKGIQRHVQRNKKVLVRERIRHILDPGSPFLEICTIAGHFMEYGKLPSAGSVCGIGKVHGVWCNLLCNDATVKGGSIYPITCRKQLRAQLISEENFLPTIYLIDSAGAFLPLQAEIFNFGGRVFYNQAQMTSKGIPQLTLVCGSCTAGAAYIPTMSEEAAIVDKIGTVFLGGPPLVQAATGEIVTPEQLGGADVHCRLSGVTDHFVHHEYGGFGTIRNMVATSNFCGVQTDLSLEPDKEMKKFAATSPEYCSGVHKIINRLADHGGFQEFKSKYGPTLVTGFMFVNKELIGVLANNGYMTEKTALKGAHFLQMCNARKIPVVFLQNLAHDESNESASLQTPGVIKARAALMQAIVKCNSPKVVISIGGLVGSPHMHPMCSWSMGARFHFVWPNVKVGAFFPWQMSKRNAEGGTVSITDYDKIKHRSSAFHGASQVWYDGIVLPEDTKQTLYFCLNIFKQERAARANSVDSLEDSSHIHTLLRM